MRAMRICKCCAKCMSGMHGPDRMLSFHQAIEASALTAARAAPLKTIVASLGGNQPIGHRPGKKKVKKLVDIDGHVSKARGQLPHEVYLRGVTSSSCHASCQSAHHLLTEAHIRMPMHGTSTQ